MKRLVFVTALAALVLAPAAEAKVWFGSVRGQTYRVGAMVKAPILGCMDPCPVRGTRVSLSAMGGAPPVRLLGTVNRHGVLTFRVPAVAPARYFLYAEGRRASDPFRIVRAG